MLDLPSCARYRIVAFYKPSKTSTFYFHCRSVREERIKMKIAVLLLLGLLGVALSQVIPVFVPVPPPQDDGLGLLAAGGAFGGRKCESLLTKNYLKHS